MVHWDRASRAAIGGNDGDQVAAHPHADLDERQGASVLAREDDAKVAHCAEIIDGVDGDGHLVAVGRDLQEG